jgi:cytochrome P450
MADSSIEKSHATVFHEIMYSSDLPPSEKSPERILCEAIQFITAGMDTVANTLYVMTFHMLDNPSSCFDSVKNFELCSQMPTTQPISDG